jgi:hypothetical protein
MQAANDGKLRSGSLQRSSGLSSADRGEPSIRGSTKERMQGLAQQLMGLKRNLVQRDAAVRVKVALFEALEKRSVQRAIDAMRSDPSRGA